jgi:predicted nucleic acid-binding protein
MAQDRHWLWAAAYEGYYTGYWSAFIVGELVRVRMRRALEHGVPYDVLRRQLNDLIHAWSDVLTIVDYRRVPASGHLADPDDEPILSTARAAEASLIVSLNTRDFPIMGAIQGVGFLTPIAFWQEIARRFPAARQPALGHRGPSL